MTVIGIDPGSEESAMVVTNGVEILLRLKCSNVGILQELRAWGVQRIPCAIERPSSGGGGHARDGKSFGTPPQVLVTCYWMGRFTEAYGASYVTQLTRSRVKGHFFGRVGQTQEHSTDSMIRSALVERFGGEGETKKGGSLYGVATDMWAALAVAITFLEGKR